MIRSILIILVFSFPLQILGQLFPQSDHYINDALDINPAYAGCHDALSASIIYRNQWVGFPDAPKSYLLSVHAPLENDRIGLGLLVEKNSIGIFKETNIIGNYAYRIELGKGRLAFGLGGGVTVYNIAWNDLIAVDPSDIQLMNNSEAVVLPALSLGTYYYTKKFFIGISMPLFLSHELDKNTGKYKIGNNFSGCNYLFSGGYEFGLNPQIKLQPSMLIRYHPGHAVQIDYNALLNLKDKIWMGVGYRTSDMLVGMLQCQINYQIRMGYSYDLQFGSIGKYTNGSHEIVLNYVFKYSRKVNGPRQF